MSQYVSEEERERRRKQVADARAESKARLEKRRDEAIALRKQRQQQGLPSTRAQRLAATPVGPSDEQVLKTTCKSLIEELKKWVVMPRAADDSKNSQMPVLEKSIATLTVKIMKLCKVEDLKSDFVKGIKQILLRGKMACADSSPENMTALTDALREVAVLVKKMLSGEPHVSPRPTVKRSKSTPSVGKPEPKTPISKSSTRIPQSASATPSNSPTPRRQEPYTGPEPQRTPALEASMSAQAAEYAQLQVPWAIDYLATQVLLLGGGAEPLLLQSFPEETLQPIADKYALGKAMWVTGRDPRTAFHLLRRYLWHLETPVILDRDECLTAATCGWDACLALLKKMPYIHRASIAYLTKFLRQLSASVPDTLRTSFNLQSIGNQFASCMFRSSSNYSSIDRKVVIPESIKLEQDFLNLVLLNLDLDDFMKKSTIQKIKGTKLSASLSRFSTLKPEKGAQHKPVVVNVTTLRKELRQWHTERSLDECEWNLPTCYKCYSMASNSFASVCADCDTPLYVDERRQPIPILFELEPGHNLMTGCGKISDALKRTQGLMLENAQDNSKFYASHIYPVEHINAVAVSGDEPWGIVSTTLPPAGVKEQWPVRILLLSVFAYPALVSAISSHDILKCLDGYMRTVAEIPYVKNNREQATLDTLRELPQLPSDCKLIPMAPEKPMAALLDFEAKSIVSGYKFGVLNQRKGQAREEEWYGNQLGSPAYNDFLALIGKRVKLSEHTHFRGGLDCRGDDSTGEYSYYSTVAFDQHGNHVGQDPEACYPIEIMWHVATELPFSSENEQQLHRKRHLGNDVVIVVFQETDEPFKASILTSQFNHVFIVVKPLNLNRSGIPSQYQVQIAVRSGVQPFRPFLPKSGTFKRGTQFRDWFLVKCINAERAAMYAKDFIGKYQRTRKKMTEHWYSDWEPVELGGGKSHRRNVSSASVIQVDKLDK